MSSGELKTVRFALAPAIVSLVQRFPSVRGDVWQVQDIRTGHCDFVGVEWLETAASPSTESEKTGK